MLKTFFELLKKELRALCFWTGITTLVLSALTLFVLVDPITKEGMSENVAFPLLLSLVGLIGGNLLWVLAGEHTIFKQED